MFRILILFLTMALILIGCEKEDQNNIQNELHQTTINELQTMIANKDQKIEQLLKEMKERELPLSELDKAIREYPWLKELNPNTKWDKVVIYRYENDPATKTIEDPLFLESMNWLLHIRSVRGESYPSGYQTDIDRYTYDFYEGEQKYTINVVDRGVIEAGRDQLYFEVDNDIHLIGAAFMPKKPFIKHEGLIAKMAASSAVKRGEQYVQLSSFRVQLRIAPLVEGTLLNNKPDQVGEKLERYIFYYYGLELVMDVYKDYVFIAGDGSEEWYYYKAAEFAFGIEPG